MLPFNHNKKGDETMKQHEPYLKKWHLGKITLLGDWGGSYVWTTYGWMKREQFETNTRKGD